MLFVMSPVLLASAAAVLTEERDPFWEAVLQAPLVEDDLSDEECAALEVGMADFRAGRVVSRDKVLESIKRMQREQGE
jgi:predicted transcriptional regulator